MNHTIAHCELCSHVSVTSPSTLTSPSSNFQSSTVFHCSEGPKWNTARVVMMIRFKGEAFVMK